MINFLKKISLGTLLILVSSVEALLAQAPAINSFTPLSGEASPCETYTGTNFKITISNNVLLLGATRAIITVTNSNSSSVSIFINTPFFDI